MNQWLRIGAWALLGLVVLWIVFEVVSIVLSVVSLIVSVIVSLLVAALLVYVAYRLVSNVAR